MSITTFGMCPSFSSQQPPCIPLPDETKVNVRGEWVWLWHLMDGDTRFLLANHVSYGRRISEGRAAFQEAKAVAKTDPRVLLTDRLESYGPAAEKEFPEAVHVALLALRVTTTSPLGC